MSCYRIPMLSARGIIAYAKKESDIYTYNLNKTHTASVLQNYGDTYQDAFLVKLLPEEEYAQYYDILTDFRHGGYRLLSDIITEIHNYNITYNDSTMHYPNDSPELRQMIKAYVNNPVGTDYRETVAAEAAKILETHIISLNMSVKYIVALGKRDFLYDAYYTHIERFVKKAR